MGIFEKIFQPHHSILNLIYRAKLEKLMMVVLSLLPWPILGSILTSDITSLWSPFTLIAEGFLFGLYFLLRSKYAQYGIWATLYCLILGIAIHILLWPETSNIFINFLLPVGLATWLFDERKHFWIIMGSIIVTIAAIFASLPVEFQSKSIENISLLFVLLMALNISWKYLFWLENYRLWSLRKQNEEQQQLLEALFDGIAFLDNYFLEDVTEDFARIFGVTPSDMADKHLFDFIPSLDISDHKNIEFFFYRDDGSKCFLQLVIQPSYDEKDIIAVRDITQQKLNQAKQFQMDRINATGTLASGIAHELNTPLMILLLNHQKLLQNFEVHTHNSDMVNMLKINENLLSNISGIIKDLKWFVQANPIEPVKSIKKTIQRTIQLANHRVRHNCNIVTEITDDTTIVLSEQHCHQILLNLIFNAAESQRDDQEIVQLLITGQKKMRYEKAGFEIVLSDDGKGISQKEQEHIFEPFFTTGKKTGTGLGLPICLSLLHNVGGDIVVKSEEGKGTSISVWIPIEIKMAEQQIKKGAEMDIKNVLIIDDEEILVLLLSEMLEQYNCFTCTHLSQVDEILQNHQIDVILSDITMSGGGGMELYHRFQKESSPLAERLIFITGGSTNRETQIFLESAKQPIIYKPFREKDIEQAFGKLQNI